MVTNWLGERRVIVEVQFSKEAAVILENHTLGIKVFFFFLERTGTTGH